MPLSFRVERLDEVTSTNHLVRERAESGEPEGLVLVAQYQSEGRGKLGRKWISPRGKNLLFSLLIRPPLAAHEAPLLTQIACRAVAKVLQEKWKMETEYKRPNDILVSGKKICGILVEASSGTRARIDYAVIGIGLNVNSTEPELVPGSTSLKQLTGRKQDKDQLLRDILGQLSLDLVGTYAICS